MCEICLEIKSKWPLAMGMSSVYLAALEASKGAQLGVSLLEQNDPLAVIIRPAFYPPLLDTLERHLREALLEVERAKELLSQGAPGLWESPSPEEAERFIKLHGKGSGEAQSLPGGLPLSALERLRKGRV